MITISNGGQSASASLTQLRSVASNNVQATEPLVATQEASGAQDAAAANITQAVDSTSQPAAPSTKSQDNRDAEFAGRLRQQMIVPREAVQPKQKTVEHTQVVHEPTRHPQVGYRNTNETVVGQYAAIYNSTAVALSRTSIEPMATERPRLAETRISVNA